MASFKPALHTQGPSGICYGVSHNPQAATNIAIPLVLNAFCRALQRLGNKGTP